MSKKKEEKTLTKAQLRKLEKQKKEQEEKERIEREAQAAEAQRLAREEFEAKRKAEKEAYRAAELERLQEEDKLYYPLQIEVRKKKETLQRAYDEVESWRKYLDCSHEYDVSSEADLNLMLVLIDELPLDDDRDLDILLARLDVAEDIIQGLEKHIMLMRGRGKPIKVFRSFIESFAALLSRKFELITNYIAQNSEHKVLERVEELKSSDKIKAVKPADLKPEVQLGYAKRHSQLAYYIMGFENSGIKTKPVDFSDFNVMSDMPKVFFSKKLIMAAKKLCREYFALGSLEHDFPYLRLVDGVVDVECLAYLPDTRPVKHFHVKRVYDPSERLERLPYTAVEGSSSSYKVYIAVPKDIITVPRDILEVRYFSDGKWTAEGVGEVVKEYNKELDKTFYAVPLPKMAPVALLMDRFAELPFHSFKLRRVAADKLLFSLVTQRVELKFEVLPYAVQLVETSQPKLSHLLHAQFKPTDLLYELQKLNVLLLNDHSIYPRPKEVLVKDVDTARNALKDVSKACLLYHVQSSRWNPVSRMQDFIVRIRENPEQDEDFFEDTAIDWRTIQFKPDSVKLLKVIENSETFSKTRKSGTVSHYNLYSLVNAYPQHFVDNYWTEVYTDDEIRLMTTVEEFLGSIQLFNFVM